MKKKWVSIHNLSSGHFQVSFTMPNAKKRTRIKFKHLVEAKRFASKTKTKITAMLSRRSWTETGFLLSSIVEYHLNHNKQSKLNSRKNILREFQSTFNDYDIFDITTKNLRTWLNSLKIKNHYANRNMRQIKIQLNVLFKYLVEEEILETNPLQNVMFNVSEVPSKGHVVFSPQELISILTKTKNLSKDIFYPYFYALIHTGGRRSELAKLKWENVSLKSKTITFRGTKNKSDRTIRIHPNLIKLLKGLKKESEYVFKGTTSNCMSNPNLYNFFKKYRRIYPDDKEFGCHDFRHSFAFNFLKKGGSMYALKAILGHKSIQMTIDLYGNFKSIHVDMPSPYNF